jgi:hypothetical protein
MQRTSLVVTPLAAAANDNLQRSSGKRRADYPPPLIAGVRRPVSIRLTL